MFYCLPISEFRMKHLWDNGNYHNRRDNEV